MEASRRCPKPYDFPWDVKPDSRLPGDVPARDPQPRWAARRRDAEPPEGGTLVAFDMLKSGRKNAQRGLGADARHFDQRPAVHTAIRSAVGGLPSREGVAPKADATRRVTVEPNRNSRQADGCSRRFQGPLQSTVGRQLGVASRSWRTAASGPRDQKVDSLWTAITGRSASGPNFP